MYLSISLLQEEYDMNRWIYLAATALVVLVTLSGCQLFMRILYEPRPREFTQALMTGLKKQVIGYACHFDRLPDSLADVEAWSEYSLQTTDAWGHPILYSHDETGLVTLASLGADGKPRGSGDDADLIGTVRTRDADGNWLSENEWWEHNPLDPIANEPSPPRENETGKNETGTHLSQNWIPACAGMTVQLPCASARLTSPASAVAAPRR